MRRRDELRAVYAQILAAANTAEMIGVERGIGAFVLSAGNRYDTDALMAGIVVLSALGLAMPWVVGLLERKLLGWR
jgi:ABC-type nitrate/sulfonate/bicarbonate transport system permease component